jgi:hypothetical protein
MNIRHRRVRSSVCLICAAALVCAAAGVSAQTVHKQVDAAGRITYSNQSDTAPSPRKARPTYSVMSARHAATIDANEAARRLAQAKLQREQGAQPLPSELARGTDANVVNHRYWQRQEKLRQVVEQAQLRYNETRRLQLAQR